MVDGVKDLQVAVHPAGDMPLPGVDEHIAAAQFVVADPGQVQGDPVPRSHFRAVLVQALQRTNPHGSLLGENRQLITDPHPAAGERPGNDRARSLRREHPVDPEPGTLVISRGGRAVEQFVERLGDLGDAGPVDRIHLDDLGSFEERAHHTILHFESGQLSQVVISQPGLRQRNETVPDPQQFQDPQMLLGLRFPTLSRRNHEYGGVNTAHARQHVLEETDMAGDVNERHPSAGGELRRSESQVDGQSPCLLLRQPVRVGPGQGLDEGGLAVVHMACGGYDMHQPAPPVCGERVDVGDGPRRVIGRRPPCAVSGSSAGVGGQGSD